MEKFFPELPHKDHDGRGSLDHQESYLGDALVNYMLQNMLSAYARSI